MTEKRGLNYAVDYLKSFKPLRLVPDAIYKRAGITGLVSSLGHSLRREARKPDNTNRVNVSYSPDESGRDVAYYTYNHDYKPQDRPKAASNGPTLCFCSIKGSILPSPYFGSIASILQRLKPLNIWTGSHDAPVLVEADQCPRK